MLEGLAAWVLNTYVGEYVENLNTDQLSIGLLQGEVELENLPLKKSALKSLDLPIEVRSGYIGKITLKIPVSRLRSEPWIISIEKLYLVAGPLISKQYDAEEEKRREDVRKKQQLDELETKWKGQGQRAAESAGWLSFGSALATNIVENLQLKVKDVHLRYEDDVTIPGCSFACGITIKNLSGQSSDESWTPQFVNRDATDMMRKLVDLQNFSIYWDNETALFGDLPRDKLFDALERDMGQAVTSLEFKDHEYILEPVTAQAKMKRNTSSLPLRSLSNPRITFDVKLDKLAMTLGENQYHGMIAMLKEYKRHDIGRKYRQWRPNCSISESPGNWWHFAIQSTLHYINNRNRRMTKSFLVSRARDNVEYVQAYTKQLMGAYVELWEKDHMAKMEEECSLEELKVLREVTMDRIEVQNKMSQELKKQDAEQSVAVSDMEMVQQQTGRLQSWFPGWAGWYSSTTMDTHTSQASATTLTASSDTEPPLAKAIKFEEAEIEQEVMDMIADSAENDTLLKRDVVFAQLNFALESGVFRLCNADKSGSVESSLFKKYDGTIVELECSDIQLGFQSRPRTSGLTLQVSLGGLYLRDKITRGSILPVLISPQTKERGLFRMRQSTMSPDSSLSASRRASDAIFRMTYEQNPVRSSADYRLDIKTDPLDIVYNPTCIKKIKEFFSRTSYSKSGMGSKPSEFFLSAAAQSHYEELKKLTQDELKQTLDQLFEGEDKAKEKRWDLHLDISAPQFIVPENLCDQNSTLVLFDLGNLKFHNTRHSTKKVLMKERTMSEDEDAFQTPLSSPPNEMIDEVEDKDKVEKQDSMSDIFAENLTDSLLHDRLYDKYTLDMSEVQVMVGRAKDNWKHAHNKGSSYLHVVDKFSISLNLERRLIYTSDPQWPSATLSGTLPRLVLHFNEQKVQALRMCSNLLSDPVPGPQIQSASSSHEPAIVSDSAEKNLHQSTFYKSVTSLNETIEQSSKEMLTESRLLLMQFSINHVSVEVQSRGRSVAELQVSGVRANYTKRPQDTSIALTVHSLLVVDALQMFGQDYELLVASHRNICLDSRSGSIASPISPQSPSSPVEPVSPHTSLSGIQAAFTSAFQSFVPFNRGTNTSKNEDIVKDRSSTDRCKADPSRLFLPISPAVDSEALITVELELINPQSPANEALCIANIQFNSLDVIANQQTIVELLSFFKSVLPSTDSKQNLTEQQITDREEVELFKQQAQTYNTRTELSADFHRLNVLLMRAVGQETECIARKVATATLSGAKIQAKIAENLEVEGSLGGLQLLDLTPEGMRHQKVFSVGQDPLSNECFPNSFVYQPGVDMYRTAAESVFSDMSSFDKAFSFSMSQSVSDNVDGGLACIKEVEDDKALNVTLRMASMCYTHSPRFLNEISHCASEFKDYMSGVASSIKSAATEVAKGLVHKKPETLASSFYGSNMSLDSLYPGTRRTQSVSELVEENVSSAVEAEVMKGLNYNIDAILQTPVIVVPRTATSSEVLVAHLGKISIHNDPFAFTSQDASSADKKTHHHFETSEASDRLYLEIRDMNLYSVNLDDQMTPGKKKSDGSMYMRTVHMPSGAEYSSSLQGVPILHNTVIELTIDKREKTFVNADTMVDFQIDDFLHTKDKHVVPEKMPAVIEISGKIVNPLKVILSKQIYEQILQTVDNVTFNENESHSNTETVLDAINEEAVNLEPSVSALKLNELEKNVFSKNSTQDRLEDKDASDKVSDNVILKASFKLPTFDIELRGDFGGGEQGLVNVNLQHFCLHFEKSVPSVTLLDLELGSLFVEDLLQDEHSEYRQLLASSVSARKSVSNASHAEVRPYLSTSCPNSSIVMSTPNMPSSLPSSFHHENVFNANAPGAAHSTPCKKKREGKDGAYPSTPPPSPWSSRRGSMEHLDDHNSLVRIKVQLVDKTSAAYSTKYNRTNRFVDVDFSGLDMTINLQTWVVLLDFLGMGAKVHDPENYTEKARMAKSSTTVNDSDKLAEEVVNTEVDLKVQSFTLIMNKSEYELARANISKLNAHIGNRDSNISVVGQLGSISLQDRSPHGQLFRERFITAGDQAVSFDIFKYGTPDPDLLRECDISVKMTMASVHYVHTHRFVQELLAFWQHFNQLQDVLGRMRAASAGQKISENAGRQGRIQMDIQAGAPVILIPHSSRSRDVMVANLGTLTVTNKFLFMGSSNTIAYKRSHDALQTDTALSGHVTSSANPMMQSLYGSLEEDWRKEELVSSQAQMSTSSSECVSMSSETNTGTEEKRSLTNNGSFQSACSSQQSTDSSRAAVRREAFSSYSAEAVTSIDDPNAHICLLDVMKVNLMDMDLFSGEWVDRHSYQNQKKGDIIFPSYVVQKQGVALLKDKCALKLQVERNLDGDISHAVPDFCITGMLTAVHCSIDITQYKLIRGLLDHNLGEPMEEFQKPLMSHLQDPKIQTVLTGEVWKSVSISMDLINVSVELLVAHEQPGCAEVSLARMDYIKSRLSYESYSDQTKVVDLVSNEILAHDTRYRDAPVNTRPNVFANILQPSRFSSCPGSLQMEIHYRSTKECARFTVLLNNMRIIGIFDWLLAVNEFLSTGPENPFKKGFEESQSFKVMKKVEKTPLTVSGGIATKRAPVMEKIEAPFELKLNITDTELVVVEDMSAFDTNAVILKSTAVLSYRPSFTERPLSSSLQSLEVFSCSLAAEEETALSIIDPTIVTLELNGSPLRQRPGSEKMGGLLDATSEKDRPPSLEIGFSTLNIRLSYNDLKLFMSIINSLPRQALQAKNSVPRNAPKSVFPATQIQKLQDLGFSQQDCEKALVQCAGRLDDAALWLMQNATPVPARGKPDDHTPLQISGIELRASCIVFCLIDDCQDADVPLGELTFNGIHYLQKLQGRREGHVSFKVNGDYYNRTLSGWEPFLEAWSTKVEWAHILEENKLLVSLSADEVLNLNVTSVMIDQYNQTKKKWTDDYFETGKEGSQIAGQQVMSYHKRRLPFIQYLLRNQTGRLLKFATVTSSPTRPSSLKSSPVDGSIEQNEWIQVLPGQDMPFLISEHEKIRHKHTHELTINQVVVAVEGWKAVSPVSIDKVGVYFRQAQPDTEMPSSLFKSQTPARIVFAVTIEGSATKVVTLRSALMLVNKLEQPLEIKLESTSHLSGEVPYTMMKLDSQCSKPVPLADVACRLWVRPLGWDQTYCNKPVYWSHLTKPGESRDSIRMCDTIGGEKATYRFCVNVRRENYPTEVRNRRTSPAEEIPFVQPGHTITFVAPVIIENLLPIEMTYYLKNLNIKGSIKPGKEAPLYVVDPSQPLELGVHFENFLECKELLIPSGTTEYRVKLRVYDTKKRMVKLLVHITTGSGGTLRLEISSPYWLVNKSGLPLMFKQDGVKVDAAGQFEEHELARSVTPLLFSFSDNESPYLCTMRVGKSVHGPGTVPQWCPRFSLESGIGMRQLHVVPMDNRPDWVYNIGIEVRKGRGRYHNTNIVTFTPRFQLDNRSCHKLAFAQRHSAVGQGTSNPEGHLSALPSCKLSFHWPRLDLDQLLCVRMLDDVNCRWSGGFRIDLVDSFHINMRGEGNSCRFLRVDVVLHGATFFIVFTDADQMPPPYRIDNNSEVTVTYYQTKVVDESLRTPIKPNSCVPYAWDEPTLHPHITCTVQGGSSATYNMNVISDGDQLCYENFFYIAFTKTFKDVNIHPASRGMYECEAHCQELVLDVQGTSVILKKKENGKRSQLWRMTTSGMIEHEGSSAPRDPRKKSPSTGVTYVLDITDIAPQMGRYMSLTVRKPDERRKTSQTWVFTDDGRLRNEDRNLYVQTRDGILGLYDGAEAVIGSSVLPMKTVEEVPIEMAITRDRVRPGSGMLSVRVVTDGPTRVLSITDIKNQKKIMAKQAKEKDWILIEEDAGLATDQKNKNDKLTSHDLEVTLKLSGGVGVSLVNKVPEELVYMALQGIEVEYSSTSLGQMFEIMVKNIQVDNQLLGSQRPVLMFITPPSRRDLCDNTPALHISAHKNPSTDLYNADIYKHLIISLKKISLQVEELLLWKLLQFVGYSQTDTEIEQLDENSFDSQRALNAATSAQTKRYYFGVLKINTVRVILSMLTTKLPPDLLTIKRNMGKTLIRFEEAKVELDAFTRYHPFETSTFLWDAISLHFTEKLRSQAAKILGSVDFLGNPLGLFNDVTAGISGLVKEGNVGGLVKNVTHGLSNAAAKFTGSLSDGFGTMTMDDHHQLLRDQIRLEGSGSSTDHIVAGFKGLGHGILGGVTSLFSQSFEGARQQGIEGLISGIGKGVVGTVTKPVAGVLDLASATASAVRDSSSSKSQPLRVRETRCCHGSGGLLPAYSKRHATAQKNLFALNENNYSEIFIAFEQLRLGREDTLHVLISSEKVYFLGRAEPTDRDNIVLEVTYAELYACGYIPIDKKYYVQLTMKADIQSVLSIPVQDPHKRPLVRCDSKDIAQKVAQQINYAKNLYDEIKQTLTEEIHMNT